MEETPCNFIQLLFVSKMTAVHPFIVAVESIIDVEDEKTSEPVSLFVMNDEKNQDDINDTVSASKMTIADGLRPLLGSMRLFGLYFNRPSEDHDEKSRKWNVHMIYGAAIVILLWINAVRMFSVFTQEDKFGPFLFNKLIVVTWSIQCAVSQTAFYAASFSGRLAVVFHQVLEDSCARHARKFTAVQCVVAWSVIILASAFFGYGLFFTDGFVDSFLAPLQSHIFLPSTLVPRIILYIFSFYLSAAYIFSQTITFVLAMIFSHQFKKVIKTLGGCLDNEHRQVSDLDIETFRQKHQEISMTVSHVDDCLMFSNASAFCCQLFCFIVLLYMLIFYHSTMNDPVVIASYVFWVFLFSFGLTLTAAGGVYVHHYVSLHSVCYLLLFY